MWFFGIHYFLCHGNEYRIEWWDYSGYFLNLDGRICAEGLCVFGIGGMAFIYVLAPVFDNMIAKINL